MELDQKERSLLARVGFFLCRDGQIPEAETIFSGLAVSAPEKDGPVVGLVLCEIIKGNSQKAVEMADKCLARGGKLASALTLYKLVALGMAGELEEARKVRQRMEADGMTKDIKTADLLLEELSTAIVNKKK